LFWEKEKREIKHRKKKKVIRLQKKSESGEKGGERVFFFEFYFDCFDAKFFFFSF